MVTLMVCHWSRCKRGQGNTTKKVHKSSTNYFSVTQSIPCQENTNFSITRGRDYSSLYVRFQVVVISTGLALSLWTFLTGNRVMELVSLKVFWHIIMCQQ